MSTPDALRIANELDYKWQRGIDPFEGELREAAAELRRQHAEIERLRDHLQFVERWANHHAAKPSITAPEALSVIQHYPPIKAITLGYADGKVPNTPDPFAESERLLAALFAATSAMGDGKPVMYRSAPVADYDTYCDALDSARAALKA